MEEDGDDVDDSIDTRSTPLASSRRWLISCMDAALSIHSSQLCLQIESNFRIRQLLLVTASSGMAVG